MPTKLLVKYLEEDRGYLTPCWTWQGCLRKGYGLMTNPIGGVHPKMISAHIYYYEKKYGKVPTGLILDHKCDHRNCVNPEHLTPTTHLNNIRRGKVPIITEQIAAQIRADFDKGMLQKDIAIKYKISQPTVSQIFRKITWS